jgi:hypothetical protein
MPEACWSPSFNPPASGLRRPVFCSNFDWLGRTNHAPPSPLSGQHTDLSRIQQFDL